MELSTKAYKDNKYNQLVVEGSSHKQHLISIVKLYLITQLLLFQVVIKKNTQLILKSFMMTKNNREICLYLNSFL